MLVWVLVTKGVKKHVLGISKMVLKSKKERGKRVWGNKGTTEVLPELGMRRKGNR